MLERVIAEDEYWLYAYQERIGNERRQWCIGDEPPQPEPHQKLHEERSMLVFFFDYKGPLVINFVPQGQRINSLYYCKLLNDLNKKHMSKRRSQKHLGAFLIHDGASSHTSKLATKHLEEIKIETLQHPPYSSDLSPCDYAIFGSLKEKLRGQRFDTLQNLQSEAKRILKDEFSAEFYQKAISGLETRWQTVYRRRGDYLTHFDLTGEHCECCDE